MNGANGFARNENDDDLFEGWFEQGELAAAPEAALSDDASGRHARAGMIVAAVAGTALILLLVFAARL